MDRKNGIGTEEKAAEETSEKGAAVKKTAAVLSGDQKEAQEKTVRKTAARKTAVRKTAAAKKPGPKAASKKAPAKKAEAGKASARKNGKSEVFIEFYGRQHAANDILEAARSDFEAKHKGVAIKSLKIYVKPEENAAYYVVNGDGCDQFKVDL